MTMMQAPDHLQSQIATEVEELELEISQAQEMKGRGEAVKRLLDHTDFNAVVMEYWFKDEAVRLAHLVSDPQLTDHQRACVQRDIEAIGGFRRFLQTTEMFGFQAAQSLQEHEEALAEARAAQSTIVAGGETEDDA